ncbi:MAG: PIG-L family deacetylase, partial [Ekhidna sp.]|nr:PIG-L family deacetylase [Ekhidna sp.]
MRTKSFLSILLISFLSISQAQNSKKYRPGEIRQKLQKLNVLGTVLYVAAHPDDENTRMIAYYANEELMRTAYLSATRGDGGQNLIGPQIREELGLIRTQELLAARRTDGGQQFFSRANDFGYSKNPDETFNIWDRDQVLADFVWTFRKFKPDVIITRFNSEGISHGHHTASAILAREAFKLSGDKNAFNDQLDEVEVWTPKKIFWNTGWWWFRRNEMDTTDLTTINVGAYNPLLGESYTEIAARSRSMHKSQGFGSSGSRGDQIEYLKQWGGDRTSEVFGGIDTSWGRVEGSETVAFFINKAIDLYDERDPSKVVEPLMTAKKELSKLNDPFWKKIKSKEIDDILVAVSGLYVELKSDQPNYTPGDSIDIALEITNRSDIVMSVDQIQLSISPNPIELNAKLLNNKSFISEMNFVIPRSTTYSHPYWLSEQSSLGMYQVSDQLQIGKPENDPAISGVVSIKIGDQSLVLDVPVVFKRTDPVDGEVTQPLSIGPPAMVNISGGSVVFGDGKSKSIDVRVIAGKPDVKGQLRLNAPDGWEITPASRDFAMQIKGSEQLFSFRITPPAESSDGFVEAELEVEGRNYNKGISSIQYDHIPQQTLYPESKVRVVRLDLKREGELIGYIEGAGDAIPENLEQIGYSVEILKKDDVVAGNLKKYDAIILGVRAFNTVDWLSYKNDELFEYAKEGGNVIV